MLELTDWFSAATFLPRPWLVVGKGPTFDQRHQFDLGQFNVLSLNHVVNELHVDVAHVIDIDVVQACAPRLSTNADWLVMPRYPHVDHAPGARRLEDYFDDLPVLRDFQERGRLVWYNLARCRPEGRSPVIGTKYFSSEAALTILARLGATTIRSLGIDGGRSYGTAFRHLADSTLLANGRPAFDLQFRQIEQIVDEWGLDYAPLVEPLRIFIGTDESQILAHRVLEYSIRKSTSVPVEIVPMLNFPTPMPADPANRPRTSFSFCRFLIPELCGYRGRALYLDADMLVFGDVAELADLSFGPNRVLCTHQTEPPAVWRSYAGFHSGRHTAVMLLDCGRLAWDAKEIVAGLDEGLYSYEELVFQLCVVPSDEIADTIPVEWNHLERYEPGTTKLLHYTVVPTQPWKNDQNPLGEIWMSEFREAVEAGAVPPEEVEALVAAGHAKPSLAASLKLAPGRQSVLTDASLDLAMARHRVAELEKGLADLRASWSWRVGAGIVRMLRRPRTLLEKGRSMHLGLLSRARRRAVGFFRND